jgi:hypothetical protein
LYDGSNKIKDFYSLMDSSGCVLIKPRYSNNFNQLIEIEGRLFVIYKLPKSQISSFNIEILDLSGLKTYIELKITNQELNNKVLNFIDAKEFKFKFIGREGFFSNFNTPNPFLNIHCQINPEIDDKGFNNDKYVSRYLILEDFKLISEKTNDSTKLKNNDDEKKIVKTNEKAKINDSEFIKIKPLLTNQFNSNNEINSKLLFSSIRLYPKWSEFKFEKINLDGKKIEFEVKVTHRDAEKEILENIKNRKRDMIFFGYEFFYFNPIQTDQIKMSVNNNDLKISRGFMVHGVDHRKNY